MPKSISEGSRNLLPHVFNLINSNIGVGLLAMPFCFHECGIILMTVTLLLMTLATYYSCMLTINSINYFRCESFERATYKSYGILGKRLVELCLIGLLFGMLVGLNVAISDLGSEIFSTVYGVKANFAVRRCVLLFVMTLVTPFCFLRRVDFLSATSSVAVIIYVIFLLNLFLVYMVPKMFSIYFSLGYFRLWRSEGLVRCVPIIASSLCCQVQVSTIYSSLKIPPLATMKRILSYALSFIFICYSVAGLMGYIAFYRGLNESLPGDMLASYPNDYRAVHIRLGFLYTVAASLPLLLFPLRTALHSLLFEEAAIEEGPLLVDVPSTIPNLRFYCLTCGSIFLSIIASQTTDKVEVILAYTGGFAGGASCYLLPAVIGAHTVGGSSGSRRKQLAKKLIIYLLYVLGILIFLSPVLTFLGVDA